MVHATPYLFLDTETGGLDPAHYSLLSIGVVVGQGAQVIDQAEFLVKHEPYIVSAGGMEVNGIDLVAHNKMAQDPKATIESLKGFLSKHFQLGFRPILVGHNIAFDRAYLSVLLASNDQKIEQWFSHRSIDTHSIAAALKDAGRIPVEVQLSSSGLFDHFGISIPEGQRHTAMADAVATFQLYWKMVELAR